MPPKSDLKKAHQIFNESAYLVDVFLDQMESLKDFDKDTRTRISISALAMLVAISVKDNDEQNLGKALDSFIEMVHGFLKMRKK